MSETELYPLSVKKRVQETLLNMGLEIKRILERYEIRYSLANNALIGAVCYQGFIPWDDSFDLWIYDQDYNKAITNLKNELPEWIVVQDSSNEPTYNLNYVTLRDIHTDAHLFYHSVKDLRKKNHYKYKGVGIKLYRLSDDGFDKLHYSKFTFRTSDFFPFKRYSFSGSDFNGPFDADKILSTVYYKNGGYKKTVYKRNRIGQYKYVNFNDMPAFSSVDEIDFRFEVHWVEHCNLNCKACGHYSPLAPPMYVDIESYRSDLQRLSSLLGKRISRINLMGGEPLLHPQIIELCRCTSELLPYTFLNLVTNGILLESLPEEFWRVCCANEISIGLTKYPIDLDYDKIEKLAARYDVDLYYYHIVDPRFKVFVLDPKGRQNIDKNFAACVAPSGIQIKHGRLYICPGVAYSHHANEYFKTDMKEEKGDYLEISKIKSAEDIIAYLSNPVPFCRFCDMEARYGIDWDYSQLKKTEWLKDDDES